MSSHPRKQLRVWLRVRLLLLRGVKCLELLSLKSEISESFSCNMGFLLKAGDEAQGDTSCGYMHSFLQSKTKQLNSNFNRIVYIELEIVTRQIYKEQ